MYVPARLCSANKHQNSCIAIMAKTRETCSTSNSKETLYLEALFKTEATSLDKNMGICRQEESSLREARVSQILFLGKLFGCQVQLLP